MNFTRWSARLPGTQRRAAARAERLERADRAAASSQPAPTPMPTGSVPAARAETALTAPSGPGGPAGPPGHDDPVPTLAGLSVHDFLGQVPALVAVVYGPDHRLAYVNDAYAA
ncbi:serine/threonine protein phosphatase, partial [Streptomyces sp. UNOC14_S4]|nr:serine/threonine protein phosphatase [Streptomyces sp. UNOC14_S4]